jgi:hypothetical protein
MRWLDLAPGELEGMDMMVVRKGLREQERGLGTMPSAYPHAARL